MAGKVVSRPITDEDRRRAVDAELRKMHGFPQIVMGVEPSMVQRAPTLERQKQIISEALERAAEQHADEYVPYTMKPIYPRPRHRPRPRPNPGTGDDKSKFPTYGDLMRVSKRIHGDTYVNVDEPFDLFQIAAREELAQIIASTGLDYSMFVTNDEFENPSSVKTTADKSNDKGLRDGLLVLAGTIMLIISAIGGASPYILMMWASMMAMPMVLRDFDKQD
mgnify:CR=1 FL=1